MTSSLLQARWSQCLGKRRREKDRLLSVHTVLCVYPQVFRCILNEGCGFLIHCLFTWFIVFTFEPAHEVMALFVLRKLILQTRICSHPVELDVWCLVGPFVYFYTSCERTAKALARLRGCAGSPEPSLVAYVISTIISWAGSFCLDRPR